MSRLLYPLILGALFTFTTEAHLLRYSQEYIFVNLIGWLTFYTSILALTDEIRRNRRPWMWTTTAIKFWIINHKSIRLIAIASTYSAIQHIITLNSLSNLAGSIVAGLFALWFYYELWIQNRVVKV